MRMIKSSKLSKALFISGITFCLILLFFISLDWPDICSSNHVLSDSWLRVQVTIHVWPSLIFCNFIQLGLIAVLFDHLRLFICKVNFIVEEMLSVG